jgi:hypothetical protein
MAPSIEPFPASELPKRVQMTMKGRQRKDKIDLEACELLEMLQYECAVEDGGRTRDARVVCRPVERLFRRWVLLLFPLVVVVLVGCRQSGRGDLTDL